MEASFGGFWPFLAIFGHFYPFVGQVRAGKPQISVEELRFEVRRWSHVVSQVNWSRFGPVWSRLDAKSTEEPMLNVFYVDWSRLGSGWTRLEAVLARVLAIFCNFWPFLPFLRKMHKSANA